MPPCRRRCRCRSPLAVVFGQHSTHSGVLTGFFLMRLVLHFPARAEGPQPYLNTFYQAHTPSSVRNENLFNYRHSSTKGPTQKVHYIYICMWGKSKPEHLIFLGLCQKRTKYLFRQPMDRVSGWDVSILLLAGGAGCTAPTKEGLMDPGRRDGTYSSTIRYLLPSEAAHLPR